MTARKLRPGDTSKDKILANKILNLLEKHGLGKHALTAVQVTAAKALLPKLSPDLKPVDRSTPSDEKLTITRIEWVIIYPGDKVEN